MDDNTVKSLYISYNAITEPIVRSQVIPYLKGLSKKGIKFCLLTFEKKKMTKGEKNNIRHMLEKEFEKSPGINWFCLRYHKNPTALATVFDTVMGAVYSAYIIVKNKIDIVHARAIVAAAAGYPAAKILSKKFIFDTRGIDSEEYVDAGLWRRGGLKHGLTRFLEGALIKSSDYVVVLTEKFLGILKKRYSRHSIKFSVFPCAVDTDRFGAGPDKNTELPNKIRLRGKFVIVYIGSLGTWYMLPEMVRFFKTVLKLIGNAHFLLLTQSDKKAAIDTIKKGNLGMEHVTIDTCTYDSMPGYLSLCDIGMFFIKPVFSKLSSSPVKFGEYLASGLPVVINSRIGDTEALVRENKVGVILESFTEDSYQKAANELMALIEDRDLKHRCRAVAEKELSLKNAVDSYGRIYKQLAGKKSGALSGET